MMRTQVMHDRAAGLPWLEQFPTDGGPPQKTALGEFPFVIGRSDDCDLPIVSNRISRRHAEILREGDGYRVRDLGSTNGTFLNGRPIDEAPLSDGDLLVVADVELTFFAGCAPDARDMATQVLDIRNAAGNEFQEGWEAVRAARRLDEIAAHRAIFTRFDPVVALETGKPRGYWACDDAEVAQGERERAESILKTDCRLGARHRRVQRMAALEQSATLAEGVTLFLPLAEVEIGDVRLGRTLDTLTRTQAGARPLVVVLPQRAVSEASYFQELSDQLRAAGMGLAHSGVVGKLPAWMSQPGLRPDYLVLAESTAAEIRRSPNRQRQAESLVRAGLDYGCDVIATGLVHKKDADLCLKLGCRLGRYSSGLKETNAP